MRKLLTQSAALKKARGLSSGPRTYFVSNFGSYSNSGTVQSEPITPDRLFVLQQNFTGKEQIYLKRGETFEIELLANVSGTVGTPFTYDAYGTGAMPKVLGSDPLGNATWTQEGELWYTPMSTPPKWIFVNGQEAKWASSPFHAITAQGTNAVTCTSLVDTYPENLVGATVIIKEFNFRVSYPYIVESYDDAIGKLILNRTVVGAGVGYGVILMGQKQFITEEGDWSWDSETQRLYIKSVASPAGTDIRVCMRDNGVYIADGVSNVRIRNINFQHQRYNGVRFRDGNNISIRWCKFNDIRKNGVDARLKCHNMDICHNEFFRMGLLGISAESGDYPVIDHNTLDTIGLSPNYGWQEDLTFLRTGGTAIVSSFSPVPVYPIGERITKYSSVRHNRISNCGYCGIQWGGSYATVEYNLVSDYMKRFLDGSGIYTYCRPLHENPVEGCVWRKNIVRSGQGNGEGTPNTAIYTSGLYVDGFIYNTIIEDNLVYDVAWAGIFVNNGSKDTELRRNTVIDSKFLVAYRQEYGTLDGLAIPANTAIEEDNTFISRSSVMMAKVMGGYASGDHPYKNKVCDRNTYIAPYVTTGKLFATSNMWLSASIVSKTLAEWQTLVGSVEQNGVFITNTKNYVDTATALADMPLIVNETLEPMEYVVPTGFATVEGTTGTITISAYAGVLLIKQ